MWARTTPNFSFISKPTRRRFLPVMRRVQVQSRVVLGCVRYECGGSLKPGAVEHAGVPRGGQGKGAPPPPLLIAKPPIIDTFPLVDWLIRVLREPAGESTSLNLVPGVLLLWASQGWTTKSRPYSKLEEFRTQSYVCPQIFFFFSTGLEWSSPPPSYSG